MTIDFMKIICLSSDLMMTGKISSLARAKNIPCQIVGSTDQLQAAAESNDRSEMRLLLLVDLQRCNDRFEVISEFATACGSDVTLVGYAQHVLPEILSSAEHAGFEQVMTRGKFDRQVAALIDEFSSRS